MKDVRLKDVERREGWSEREKRGGSAVSRTTQQKQPPPQRKEERKKRGEKQKTPQTKAKIPLDRPAFLITLWLLLVWRRESYPIRHTTHNIKHQPKNPCTPIGEPSSPLPPRCLSPRAPSLNHPGREPLFFFSLTCKPPWYQQPTPGVGPLSYS